LPVPLSIGTPQGIENKGMEEKNMRRSLGLLAMVAAVAALPAVAANAPTAEKPVAKVGDVFEYVKRFASIDCQRWEVKAVAKDGYNILQCGDYSAYLDMTSATLTRITSGDKKLFEYNPHYPAPAFPLELGKKWQGKYDGYRADQGASWKSEVNCEAKAFETVKVPAGEFEAYRVACEDNWEASPFRGTADATYWYAPKIGTIVKAVNPSDSAFDYELASYHVK
jgi:hypothetical protein